VFAKYLRYVNALSVNWIGRLGVVLTTSSFVTFVILEIARLAGIFENAYAGLVTYLSLPLLFVVGLVLIPLGWRKLRRDSGIHTRELLVARFGEADTRRGFFGSRVFLGVGALTLLNVVFLGMASARMLAFMDTPHFCGTACHSVMSPEWTTYQESPHARVHCVECHVGEGVGALIDSKISGMRQIVSVTFDLLERPIPTPVHDLRPSRETCEHCHWPDKFYGRRLKTLSRYAKDEASTPAHTTLALKIDAGTGGIRAGIHWHIAEENEIRYISVDDEREEMIWVEVRQPDGTYKRYTNRRLRGEGEEAEPRVLDCVDCHNRATHIYEDPGDAVDGRLALGLVDRSLPYVKRAMLAALTAGYNDEAQAVEGIEDEIRGYYRRAHPQVARSRSEAIDEMVTVARAVYRRNIHHQMNIDWNTYPTHIGHRGGGGCFRCHNPDMVANDGEAVSSDCTLCHSILAYESDRAFAFVQPPDSTSRDYRMHEYLMREFVASSAK
jgi:hypothetical protein